MPPKVTSTLAGMLQSDDSDVEMLDENTAPPKKPIGRKPRKAKPASKRLSGSKRKAPAKSTKRAPLVERSNGQQPADDTEEVDEFAEEQPQPDDDQGEQDHDTEPEIKPARKRGRPAGKKAGGKQALSKEQAQELEEVVGHAPNDPKNRPPGAKIKSAAARRGAPKAQTKVALAAEAATVEEIVKSQAVENDIDESGLHEDQVPQSVFRQNSNARASSRQPQPLAGRAGHRRIGSNSDSERAGDATLRRKLGDVTKKYENLQDRYTKLVEVGIKEAEANFERLKQQSQAQEKVANDLIASLRADLAAATNQNTSLSTQITKAKEQAKAGDEKLKVSESQLAALTEKLRLAQTENNLLAKLAATRNAPNSAPKVPGSAAKNRNAIGNANAAAEVAIGQLKENLYSDLTGLILRNVEQTKGADIFDCLQTGRNGTLHFRLSVDHAEEGVSFEETEFQYTPRLDENRDRELLEILPDYLTEEITFSRTNAAKFYSRINDTLTRKLD